MSSVPAVIVLSPISLNVKLLNEKFDVIAVPSLAGKYTEDKQLCDELILNYLHRIIEEVSNGTLATVLTNIL